VPVRAILKRGGHSVQARTGLVLKSGDAADLTLRHFKGQGPDERLALSLEWDGAWCWGKQPSRWEVLGFLERKLQLRSNSINRIWLDRRKNAS